MRIRKNNYRVRFPLATCVFVILIVAGIPSASAQSSQQKSQPQPQARPNEAMSPDRSSPTDDTPQLTTFEEELRAKRAIKLAEKEHEENVSRARDIAQIAREIQDGIKKRPVLDREGLKKIDRLEKLTKKIRGEAGGEDTDPTVPQSPTDLVTTITRMVEVAETLSKSVQNTPRQVVSACVIDNANVLLELIKLARNYYH